MPSRIRRKTQAIMWRIALALAVHLTACGDATPTGPSPGLDESRRLAALGQVWGLLKYYHPQVAARADWDDVLIAAVPAVEQAADARELNRELMRLLTEAGGASGPSYDGGLGRALQWIDDPEVFEGGTRARLRALVAAHRPGPNRYVAPVANNGKPDFAGDVGRFQAPAYPDRPTRLLALFRYWNMIQYYFPSRELMDRGWLEQLPELVALFAGAADAAAYHLAAARMTAGINDAHAYTASVVLGSYFGVGVVPVQVRLVEGRTVVTRVLPQLLEPSGALRVGDVVTQLDGVATEVRRASLRPLLHGSNAASLERNVDDYLLRTNATRVALTVETEEGSLAAQEVGTVPLGDYYAALAQNDESVSRLLPGDVGYVHMGLLLPADVDSVMARLRDTRAIVFDLRNYPNGTLSLVASYLSPTPRPFAIFQMPSYDDPGSLLWTEPYYTNAWGAPPAPFVYAGRTVVLVNQETQSQAEFTVMALRSLGAVVVGSETAGADGDVSLVKLPGGISTYFSGLGVFYPDRTPTQRVGIVPDLTVSPTLHGLRGGRDEVLEAALGWLAAR